MNQSIVNQVAEQSYYSEDEISLRELFGTLWRGKWIILLCTVVCAAVGVGYALSKPNIYQASVLLAPAQDEGGAGGLRGQLGGLASLAGISLGGGGGSPTLIAKEVLQSRAFLTSFIHRHDLSVQLKAVKEWDLEVQKWLYDREIYNPDTGEWLTDLAGKSLKPTDWDLVKAFKGDHLSISENKDTGMLTVSIKHLSPTVAKNWAMMLVADINEHMRREDVSKSEARIAYLESKLQETNIAGMQQVFYQLIESETRTVMLANAQQEYVFKTIDPAVEPQENSEPKRLLIIVLAVMLGGCLGVFIAFLRVFIQKK
ncbi:Wzz/FepE/Etk N-terminal domain-containing protein [Marinobacter sp. S0848L]|uniref:Wzz/FepE/Etk N-terminal domain-containing protein n=1 Tax=Marinobacter sp. S0848L TaxID=2926423 RepID=UPI001FF20211|nr:Wzz/FepE/Etk N-terminal domain-containing protein [Marinobacter sp. S0848L]MCK0107305.1 Wzz/FepE/Etk N-terminal domain-containing protein [Marinobacter sp. S0848L]